MTDQHRTVLYDVEVIAVEPGSRELTFQAGQRRLIVSTSHPEWWSIGQVGCLTLSVNPMQWTFRVYPDPRLRRAPELDDAGARVWGWRLGARRIVLRQGVTPGKNGAYVPDQTTSISLDVPPEFTELCAACECSPATVLRGFIGDLCGLRNYCACPREDGYSSHGSDERWMAQSYFERVYGIAAERYTSRLT